MSMNPFAGMNDAKTSQSGTYFKDGRFKVKIDKCVFFKTQAGPYAFIVEVTVVESNNTNDPVGASRTWFQKDNESLKPELKSFCYAALGYDERKEEDLKTIKASIEQKTEAVMNKALSHNILKGRELHLDVTTKPQKKDPTKNFAKHVFTAAQPPLPVELIDKALALP